MEFNEIGGEEVARAQHARQLRLSSRRRGLQCCRGSALGISARNEGQREALHRFTSVADDNGARGRHGERKESSKIVKRT